MILEDLWSGRFYPAETGVPMDPKYREINREISENIERLKTQLTPEQFAQVEQLLEQMALSHSMELESQFCFGFAAGMQLQLEVACQLKKRHSERCLPIRKHRGAREKRYSFGYAVFLILALMK